MLDRTDRQQLSKMVSLSKQKEEIAVQSSSLGFGADSSNENSASGWHVQLRKYGKERWGNGG